MVSRLVAHAEQMRDVEIFVEIWPVNAEASADALPVSALLVSGTGQPWELRQRGADLAAILHRQVDPIMSEAHAHHGRRFTEDAAGVGGGEIRC